MLAVNRPTFNPAHPVVMAPATLPTPAPAAPATPKPAQEVSRAVEQKRYVSVMLTRLGQDARLAAIMINPIFAVHAQGIAHAATGRAIARYEHETPRKDFSVLMQEEQAAARQAILGLPARYQARGEQALEATGDAIVEAYDVTTNAVATAAERTGVAVKTGVLGVLGAFAAAGKGLLRGLGAGFSSLGKVFSGAGGRLASAGG